jgi:hypothetical protein
MWLSLDDPLGSTAWTLRQQSLPLGTLGSGKGGWPEATWASSKGRLVFSPLCPILFISSLGRWPLAGLSEEALLDGFHDVLSGLMGMRCMPEYMVTL